MINSIIIYTNNYIITSNFIIYFTLQIMTLSDLLRKSQYFIQRYNYPLDSTFIRNSFVI